jgi:2-amino-4-hydroxy-6-hydroxymethyldihydropteridine diphosphokinase
MKAYISLGANLGDREATLRLALEHIDTHPDIRVTQCSTFIETEPVGYTDQPSFINAVAELDTELSAQTLLDVLLGIESGLGRLRTIRWGPRTIDLDLLFYGDMILNTDTLTIPHPRFYERSFFVSLMSEIAPDFTDPVSGRSMREINRSG